MSAPTTAAAVTAEQLEALPDDGQRHELVRGQLRTMSPEGFRHGRVALRIASRLERHVEEHSLGVAVAAETGFRISRSPDTVRAPDAAFVGRDRLPPPEEQVGFLDVAPDLVVEVVSPSDRAGDVLEKTRQWLAAGVLLVWVVHPEQRLVLVHGAGEPVQEVGTDGDLDGGEVLPGLRLPIAELLA